MKRIHLGLYAILTSAVLMVACTDDQLFEDNHHSLIPSETISFDAVVEWPSEDYIGSRNALTPADRVGKSMLHSVEGCDSLSMEIYVQDGIYPDDRNETESRGAVLTQEAMTSFDVWATLNKANDGGVIEFFSDLTFSKNNNVFSSADTYYWPGEGTIDFVAVGNAPDGFTATFNEADNEVVSFNYTVPSKATEQNDIVLATAPGIAGNNNQAVPLDFKHIMSAVNVKIGTEMTAGTINSITFKNINSKGTYNVANSEWTGVDTGAEYKVIFEDNNENYHADGTNTDAVIVNADNATFMMIPQALAEGAQIIVDFTYDATGKKVELEASLSGQEWEMGKTTNYMINIKPDFVLEITEDNIAVADCHYDIREITISDESNVGWTLSSNADWVQFRVKPADYETSEDYINFRDYWIETHTVQEINVTLNNQGEETVREEKTPVNYNLESTLNGKGSTRVMVYFYENVGEKPQNTDIRTAKISLAKDAGSNESDYIEVKQFYPLWNNGIAFERIEENDNSYPWGFNSDLKIKYSYPSIESNIETGLGVFIDRLVNTIIELIRKYNRREAYDNFIENFQADNYPEEFMSIDRETSQGWFGAERTEEWSVELDYSKLSDLGNIGTSQSGLTNTRDLVDFVGGAGNSSITNLENWLESNMDDQILGGTKDNTSIASTAVFQATKKNKRVLTTIITNITSTNQGQTQTESNVSNSISYPTDQYIVWFLPAKEELSDLATTAHDNIDNSGDTPLSGTYWTSSAVSTNNTQAYKYSIADGEVSSEADSRNNTYKIRAARVKP